ncbi:MAG: gliding-motility protein MglA [Alphaproteobacteria bacterium]|nr:gliding-motility protein MglA [Alphaproteobacteria bacterium]
MKVHTAQRLMTLKVVYYGPGMSGKTTNLRSLHGMFGAGQRGALVQLDTETERTLFFDYFPVVIGEIRGFRLKVDLFTVPGQSFYQTTRRVVLDGADGIVFVADSHPDREEANLLSREDMVAALTDQGRDLQDVPHVYQWNKRDVRGAVPTHFLGKQLNPEKAPAVEAVAEQGIGVQETHRLVLQGVIESIRNRSPRPPEGPVHA